MIEILINGGVAIVSALAGSWGGWFFARKKYNSEVDGNVIANMEKSLEFYEKLSNDNKQRLEKVLEDDKTMRADMEAISKENKILKESVEALTKENKELRKSISELKTQMINFTSSVCTDLTCKMRSEDFSTLDLNNNTNEKSKPRKTVRKSSTSK